MNHEVTDKQWVYMGLKRHPQAHIPPRSQSILHSTEQRIPPYLTTINHSQGNRISTSTIRHTPPQRFWTHNNHSQRSLHHRVVFNKYLLTDEELGLLTGKDRKKFKYLLPLNTQPWSLILHRAEWENLLLPLPYVYPR